MPFPNRDKLRLNLRAYIHALWAARMKTAPLRRIFTAGFGSSLQCRILPFRRASSSLREAAASGFSTATDLADWLVREAGLPFREAHHVTGRLVALAESEGRDLPDLTLEEMQSAHEAITVGVFDVLGVDNSVRSRTSYGGTAPEQVRHQIGLWKDKLA